MLMRQNSNENITIKTFPGAGTEDMKDYIRLSLKTSPDHAILHIGTNDIKKNSFQTLAENVINLANQITSELTSDNK